MKKTPKSVEERLMTMLPEAVLEAMWGAVGGDPVWGVVWGVVGGDSVRGDAAWGAVDGSRWLIPKPAGKAFLSCPHRVQKAFAAWEHLW